MQCVSVVLASDLCSEWYWLMYAVGVWCWLVMCSGCVVLASDVCSGCVVLASDVQWVCGAG